MTDQISAQSTTWIANMENVYPTLPSGPVICKTCANSGHKVEMQRHPQSTVREDRPSHAEDADLQTFRCPDCENISVFRVD